MLLYRQLRYVLDNALAKILAPVSVKGTNSLSPVAYYAWRIKSLNSASLCGSCHWFSIMIIKRRKRFVAKEEWALLHFQRSSPRVSSPNRNNGSAFADQGSCSSQIWQIEMPLCIKRGSHYFSKLVLFCALMRVAELRNGSTFTLIIIITKWARSWHLGKDKTKTDLNSSRWR
jgi:hypothetical protein